MNKKGKRYLNGRYRIRKIQNTKANQVAMSHIKLYLKIKNMLYVLLGQSGCGVKPDIPLQHMHT